MRAAALESARGSTDFGEYFVYFSFFLVVAALLLAGLFFRLGLEQRLREVGLLEALGFSAKRLRRLYLGEGLVLSALGGLIGAAGAAAYAAAVLWALRTLWTVDLGTRDLTLHLGVVSPLVGAIGAALAAVASVAWTLRSLQTALAAHPAGREPGTLGGGEGARDAPFCPGGWCSSPRASSRRRRPGPSRRPAASSAPAACCWWRPSIFDPPRGRRTAACRGRDRERERPRASGASPSGRGAACCASPSWPPPPS